jgi:hypothetical protein
MGGARAVRIRPVETRQLSSTPGFVLLDVPEAPTSVGPTRLGARLIPANAVMYARCTTYAFAVLEQQRAGCTIGLRSEPDGAADAVAALAGELADDLAAQRILTSPGMRLTAELLAPVLQHDQRAPMRNDDRDGVSFEDELLAVAAVAATEAAGGGLDGRTVAIEGFGPAGVALAREIERAGGTVGRIATGRGTATGSFGAAELQDAWAAHDEGLVEHLGTPGKPWAVFAGEGIDVLFVGSEPGRLTGQGAATLGTAAVVPYGPGAVTARALADLRRAGAPVLPDFVVATGPMTAWWPPDGADHDAVRAAAAERVAGLLGEDGGHPDGPYLGACYRAEAFMSTWMEELPFGRPLG